MRDFGLPLLLPMLQGQPGRQRLVLQVVYAFSADTPAAHVGVIKGLQEALDQQATPLPHSDPNHDPNPNPNPNLNPASTCPSPSPSPSPYP